MRKSRVVTREIPKSEWNEFCNEFSRLHCGWLASVQVAGESKTQESPFQKLALAKGDRQNKISIVMDGESRKPVRHTIDKATHLRVEQDRNGVDQSLEVEAKSGTTTILRFINSALSRKKKS